MKQSTKGDNMKLTCQQIEDRLRASFETLDDNNPIFVTHEDFLCEVAKIAKEQFDGDTVVFPGRNPRFPETDGLHTYTWSVYSREELPPIQTGKHGEPIHVIDAHVWRDAFEVEAQVKLDCAHSFIVYGVSVK
jgi:hypothetical protein